MALTIGPPLIIPFLLFGGYFLNSGSVPEYFKWLSYLSWFRYGNEALLINQWSGVGPGEIICTRANTTCPSDGHVVLETLNFDEVKFPCTFQAIILLNHLFCFQNDMIFDIVGLVLLIIGFRLLAYISLALRARSKE